MSKIPEFVNQTRVMMPDAYMPTLETKTGRGRGSFFSEGCKMVHSAAFWI
jgi:hypothetical protein